MPKQTSCKCHPKARRIFLFVSLPADTTPPTPSSPYTHNTRMHTIDTPTIFTWTTPSKERSLTRPAILPSDQVVNSLNYIATIEACVFLPTTLLERQWPSIIYWSRLEDKISGKLLPGKKKEDLKLKMKGTITLLVILMWLMADVKYKMFLMKYNFKKKSWFVLTFYILVIISLYYEALMYILHADPLSFPRPWSRGGTILLSRCLRKTDRNLDRQV